MKHIYTKIASHIIAWGLFLSLPFLFTTPVKADKFPVFIIIPWLFIILFYYANYYLLIPKLLLKKKIIKYILVVCACLFSFILIPELIFHFNYKITPKPPIKAMETVGRLGFIVIFLLTFIISSGISLINEFFTIQNKKQQVEIEKSKAELAFLQSQVNPHFLFNTLYSIYQLTVSKSDKAPVALIKLSDIMRYVLTESQCNYIPLHMEIAHINKYIDLQKLRISEKTRVNFTVIGNLAEKLIAPLLLIPFVENAFKYGVSSHEETTIHINLSTTATSFEFSVTNNKFQSLENHEKNNIGLDNVRNRLQLLYPESHKLLIYDEANGYQINLKISNYENKMYSN